MVTMCVRWCYRFVHTGTCPITFTRLLRRHDATAARPGKQQCYRRDASRSRIGRAIITETTRRVYVSITVHVAWYALTIFEMHGEFGTLTSAQTAEQRRAYGRLGLTALPPLMRHEYTCLD
jgi:hypothetical protein